MCRRPPRQINNVPTDFGIVDPTQYAGRVIRLVLNATVRIAF